MACATVAMPMVNVISSGNGSMDAVSCEAGSKPSKNHPTVTLNNQETALLTMRTDKYVHLLHDNRIYTFIRQPSDDNQSSSSNEQNVILNLLTTSKYRIMSILYNVLQIFDKINFLLVIVLSILNNNFTMPTPSEWALFGAIGIEIFYDVMLYSSKLWTLQRVSIYIGLLMYIVYACIIYYMNIHQRFTKYDLCIVMAVVFIRFIAFILEEFVDVAIDGELHNDLLKIRNKKNKSTDESKQTRQNQCQPSQSEIGSNRNKITDGNAEIQQKQCQPSYSKGRKKRKTTIAEIEVMPPDECQPSQSKVENRNKSANGNTETQQNQCQSSHLNARKKRKNRTTAETKVIRKDEHQQLHSKVEDKRNKNTNENIGIPQNQCQSVESYDDSNLSNLKSTRLKLQIVKIANRINSKIEYYLDVTKAVSMPENVFYVGSFFAWGPESVFTEDVWTEEEFPRWFIWIAIFPTLIPAALLFLLFIVVSFLMSFFPIIVGYLFRSNFKWKCNPRNLWREFTNI